MTKNKTKKNKRVKISQKNIVDVATAGLNAISVEIAKFQILAGGNNVPDIVLILQVQLSKLEDELHVLKRDRAAQISARASKQS